MNEPLRLLTYGLILTAVVLFGLWIYLRWRGRQKDPAEVERRRRLHINRIGRIANGRVTELLDAQNGATDGPPRLIVYRYEVRGVDYQAAQDIGFLGADAARLDLRKVASGHPVSVKYDPKNPPNSIILCEVWNGLA